MCGWIGKGSLASSPARAISFRAVAGVIGPPRSVTNKYGDLRILAPQLAQCPELGTADRVRGGEAVLESRDVHQAGLEVDLLPAHRDELRDAQPMPVGEEDERPIARTVAADLARGLQELLDLRRREILAGAPIKIFGSARGDGRVGGRSRSRL